MDSAGRYEIRVAQHLGASTAALFPECECTDEAESTVMQVSLPDQAALHGIITRIRDLGLTLIAVNRLPDSPTDHQLESKYLSLHGVESMTTQTAPRIVTESMLKPLPEPIRRYLTYTGVIGFPWIESAFVQYTGKFRTAADKPWMKLTSKQVFRTNPPYFCWKARMNMFGLPLVSAQDSYENGHGHMFGKLAGLATLFDARSEQMDQGTMMRYLAEMIWFPTAFLSDYITWTPIDAHVADATFTFGSKQVTGRLFVDDGGRLLNFSAQRYRENKGSYSLDTWSAPNDAYGKIGGLNLPVSGWALWQLPEGDLPYIQMQITEIVYNQPVTI